MGDKIIKSRQSNYDLLRIISTLAVVAFHVSKNVDNDTNISLVGFNICSLINIITRFSVPCFVMLSGAFILNNERNADYKHFYAKSFYKIGIPLIIFSFLMLIISEVSAVLKGSGLAELVLSLLKGEFNNYWFMFMLAGLYFLVPIIIRIKNTISKKCYTIGSFVWLLVAMISQLTSTYSVAWSFGIIFSFVGYFLIGNVIYENMSRIKFKGLYFIFAIISYVLLFVFRDSTLFIKHYENAYSSWFCPLIIISSICVFIAFSGIKIKINLGKLSGYTYVIYLLHTKVYIVLLKLFEKFIPSVTGNYIVYIAIVTILAFIISCIGAMIYDSLWSLLEKKFNLKEKWNSRFN